MEEQALIISFAFTNDHAIWSELWGVILIPKQTLVQVLPKLRWKFSKEIEA
jgi:hypothetical protein